MSENRVVVTGLGAVTPIGTGVQNFWNALIEGKSGIGRTTHIDVTNNRSKLAAEVTDFDPEKWIDHKTANRMARFTQFAMVASSMAIDDAGLDEYEFDPVRSGVIIGSGNGGSEIIEQGYEKLEIIGPKGLQPFFISKLLVNMAACMVSIRYGLKGPISAPSVACSTGANAIGDAFRILQRGDAEIMLAGSAEASITRLAYGGFCATRSMTCSEDAETASRPFDKNRDGFVMGEGGGVVVLETMEHAQNRKARIYAELAGYGNTADAYHFTAPHPECDGMIRVMQNAINDSGIQPDEIDYINAHGTSTVLNDKCESRAIQQVFGDHAHVLKVSSNKSMIGHLLGGAGSVEFVAMVLSLIEGLVPPTINYQEADPDCPLDYVTNGAEALPIRAALSNSFGFGGGNVSLLIKKYQE